MATVDGTWNVETKTPMGPKMAKMTFRTEGDTLLGECVNDDETVEVLDGTFDGTTAKWTLKLHKPFPMTGTHEAMVDGDVIEGTMKAMGQKMKIRGTRQV